MNLIYTDEFRTTCTSGDKYIYHLNSMEYDIYKAKRDVPNPEGYGIIPAGSEIADVTFTLGFFKRLYAKIMHYVAWQFTQTDDSRPADYYFIKGYTLYRYSGFFTLEGTHFLPQRTKMQTRIYRIKEWFNEKFGRTE